MTTPSIAGEIHAFLGDQILSGQDAGLTATTPLLELGILNSFGLFKLVAHLNERYGVDIKPEEITGRDFKNIESIVDLVGRRLASVPRPVPPHGSLEPQPLGIAVFEAPACAQVFMMFTGLGGVGMPGRGFAGAAKELVENSPEFFKRARLDGRNLVLFHDARGQSYKHGVSAELPSRAAIFEWLGRWIAERPHIEEIYCIGVSAGGLMAMLAGNLFKAKTVWAFAPRAARGNLAKESREELSRFAHRVTGKSVWDLEKEMTPDDQEKIDASITPDMIDRYYKSLLDPEILLDAEHLAEVVHALSSGNRVTEYRVYYVPRDASDALVVEKLRACPGVTPIQVEPSDVPPTPWAFSRWIHPERWVCRDHLVVDLLRERGVFGTLFPPFRAAGVTAASL